MEDKYVFSYFKLSNTFFNTTAWFISVFLAEYNRVIVLFFAIAVMRSNSWETSPSSFCTAFQIPENFWVYGQTIFLIRMKAIKF